MFAFATRSGKLDCGVSREHWDEAYASGIDRVSWHQARPTVSLELVEVLAVAPGAAEIDVGGGGAFLADELVERGFTDITVLDVSRAALDAT
jgi:hypothetical protein